MNNSLFLFLSQHRILWRLPVFVDRMLFWFRSHIFSIKYGLREEKIKSHTLWYLFRITRLQIFLAITFAVILLVIDPYFHEFFEKFNLKIPDDSDYVTLLATISGIGGVFIGLYYTSIISVASSIYARVPNNIRDLLAQERHGNVYMRFLSFLTFLGLVLIALRIIGFSRIYLAIPIMILFSGIGIISFVGLGKHAFYLFDPTAFSSNLFEKLRHHLETIKAGGFRWSDKNFQNHAYKQASLSLDTLHTLSDITLRETHLRGKPFLTLCEHLLYFLIAYEKSKKTIPSDSQWYEQKYKHRDWYRTEDSHISIAHQTGTGLQLEVTSNKEWVEDRVIPIIKDCLAINLKEKRYNEVLGFIQHLDFYLKSLAIEGRVDRALDILTDLSESILDTISPESKKELVTNEVLEKLAIIEQFAVIPVTIALACHKYVEKLDADKVEKKLSKITWEKEAELYKHEFPAYCLPTLEWLKPRLSFEISTEGYLVSPIWYQKELLLQTETDVFTKNTNSLISKSSELYGSWISKTMQTKHPWLAGAVMSREWEFWHKVESQIEMWQAKWNDLSKDRKIKGLPWENFEGEQLKATRKNRQAKLLQLMSEQSLTLNFLERPEGFPDYAGQFLHTTGEMSFDSLLTNNMSLLSSSFKLYLCGCITKFEKLRPKSVSTADWSSLQNFKIALAPLLDLMDISGYARLMADYHRNNELWQIVVATWDKYFETKTESKPSWFAQCILLTGDTFEIPHRGILRTSWNMRVKKKLSDVPRHERYSQNYIYPDTVIDHKSALVRVFAREQRGSSHDGITIFGAFYLRTKEDAKELDFGWRERSLQDCLDREERNNQANDDGEVPK